MISQLSRVVSSQLGNVSLEKPTRPMAWRFMKLTSRFHSLRGLMVRLTGTPAKALESDQETFFPNIDVNACVEGLRMQGHSGGFELPPRIYSKIYKYALSTPCFANGHPKNRFLIENAEEMRRRIGAFGTANYFYTQDCTAIAALAKDPVLISIAHHYFGTQPFLLGTLMWWSFPIDADRNTKSKHAQLFHFDMDDYKFIKFFFYLEDVSEESGPHVVVRGTHRHKALRHQFLLRRFPDAEIETTYGLDNIVKLCGAAGTGFVEDTFCFHKGLTPISHRRLLLQIAFGVNDFRTLSDERFDRLQLYQDR